MSGALRVAIVAAVAAAAGASACRSVIVGSDDEYINAAVDLCRCSGSDEFKGIYEDARDCEETVASRLQNAGGRDRENWLDQYSTKCTGQCAQALQCYYILPVCSFSECKTDKECCSFDGGVGACGENDQCAPLP